MADGGCRVRVFVRARVCWCVTADGLKVFKMFRSFKMTCEDFWNCFGSCEGCVVVIYCSDPQGLRGDREHTKLIFAQERLN